MKCIERETIGEAHEEVIRAILLDGFQQETKHGITLEYPEAVAIKILNPLKNPRISSVCNFTEEMATIYAKQLQTVIPKTGTNKDFDYNCGNRWLDYPVSLKFDNGGINPFPLGDGDNMGFNQVEKMIIEELIFDNTSRRAIICSIYPPLDKTKKHIPCISFLQFLIRQNKLNMEVYIRSNDMLSAWGSDAFALSTFQNMICQRLQKDFKELSIGYMELISVSAHIYFKRDAPELLKFRRKINV